MGCGGSKVELEAAFTLTGIDGRALYELLIDDDLENFRGSVWPLERITGARCCCPSGQVLP